MPFQPNDLHELDELTEESLGFSALSAGLGFTKNEKGPHPAAKKGAPPAPPSRAPAGASARDANGELPSVELDEEDEAQLPPRSPGSGAVAGGPIWTAPSITEPVNPVTRTVPSWQARAPEGGQRPMPASGAPPVFQGRTYTPPSRPATPNYGPNYGQITPHAAASPAPATANATAPSAAQVLAEPAASPVRRLVAFALDALFVALPLGAAWWVSFRRDAEAMFLADPKSPLLLFAAIFGAYFLLSESFGGQSLGKMLLGLRVVEDDKYEKPTRLRHAALRLLLTVVGSVCGGLGLLAALWDSKRRPWQDRYTGSIVRRSV